MRAILDRWRPCLASSIYRRALAFGSTNQNRSEGKSVDWWHQVRHRPNMALIDWLSPITRKSIRNRWADPNRQLFIQCQPTWILIIVDILFYICQFLKAFDHSIYSKRRKIYHWSSFTEPWNDALSYHDLSVSFSSQQCSDIPLNCLYLSSSILIRYKKNTRQSVIWTHDYKPQNTSQNFNMALHVLGIRYIDVPGKGIKQLNNVKNDDRESSNNSGNYMNCNLPTQSPTIANWKCIHVLSW